MTNGEDRTVTGTAISLAEISGREVGLLDQLEGRLLQAGGSKTELSPAELATVVDMGRSKVVDVFRQLRQTGAVEMTGRGAAGARTAYSIDPDTIRAVFVEARQAIDIITRLEERSPPEPQVQPLVTFPEDPSFEGVSPYDFDMKWLMPSLTAAIKDATQSITIITPFFDRDGFENFQGVLIDALERGVELTIITRYLADESSYNRYVLSSFVEQVRDAEISTSSISFLDYTVWDADIPVEDRRQEGENPAFTLHAKLMLFDDREAYVGSANVTDYGFDRYLELGMLLSGPPVPDLAELVYFLIDSEAATEVEISPPSS